MHQPIIRVTLARPYTIVLIATISGLFTLAGVNSKSLAKRLFLQ